MHLTFHENFYVCRFAEVVRVDEYVIFGIARLQSDSSATARMQQNWEDCEPLGVGRLSVNPWPNLHDKHVRQYDIGRAMMW